MSDDGLPLTAGGQSVITTNYSKKEEIEMKLSEDQKARLDQELDDIFASPQRTLYVISELALTVVQLTPMARQYCPELLDVLASGVLNDDATTVLAATECWQREADEEEAAEEAAQLN